MTHEHGKCDNNDKGTHVWFFKHVNMHQYTSACVRGLYNISEFYFVVVYVHYHIWDDVRGFLVDIQIRCIYFHLRR